jgi:hypothetical protein
MEGLKQPPSQENYPPASIASMYIFNETPPKEWGRLYARYENSNKLLTEKIPKIIKKALNDKDWDISLRAVRMIAVLPEVERAELLTKAAEIIKKALDDKDRDVRREAVRMIAVLPEVERAEIIKKALDDKDWGVRREAVKMIAVLPEVERAEIIKKALDDKDWGVRREAVEMIAVLPEVEQAELLTKAAEIIKEALDDKDRDVRREAVEMIAVLPEVERGKLEKELEDKENQKPITPVSHPLYARTSGKFFRKEFAKTGTKTTLLGQLGDKSLVDKAIIRHIPLSAYLSWKKAFENYEFWEENGFSYVPIEPILSVTAKGDEWIVNVFSQVLGPSASQWLKSNTHFRSHINLQMNNIRKLLTKLGIEHGHLHENNFCLVFNKNSDGTPDYTKTPRVYAIDFDTSTSKP